MRRHLKCRQLIPLVSGNLFSRHVVYRDCEQLEEAVVRYCDNYVFVESHISTLHENEEIHKIRASGE